MDKTNPEHYKAEAIFIDGKYFEPIDLCESYNFCLGNAVKYILRAEHHKDGLKLNYQKARWYLQRLLEQDYLVYTKIFPEGDGKYNVVKILSVYRSKFHALDLLFDSVGAASLISIESALNFINERINDEN